MGGGIADWFTPGWTVIDKSLAPHISEPAYVKQMIRDGENPKE
jgi:hypothetical protein